MKLFASLLVSIAFLSADLALAGAAYPKNPDPQMTPGALCTTPTEYRYAEHIPYCERDVETHEKRAIIELYDMNGGYAIGTMPRANFKIDHYIPLCMGGANGSDNLWPQHISVYQITDPLEAEACEKMKAGRLKQAEAVDLIKQAKNNLLDVEEIRDYVRGL